MRVRIIDQHTARTVHRFNSIVHFINFGKIHIFPVVIPVTGADPQIPVQNHGGHRFFIVIFTMYLMPIFQQRIAQTHAIGMEEGEAGAFVVQAEQIQLLA